jgi:hypothetical protein
VRKSTENIPLSERRHFTLSYFVKDVAYEAVTSTIKYISIKEYVK